MKVKTFSLAAQGSTIPAEGAQVVDGGGATLMPGRDVQRGSRTWLFEAKRSISGPLFPFYTFRMKV